MAAKGKDNSKITRDLNEVIVEVDGKVDGEDQFDGEVNSDGDDGFILIWPDLQKTFENAKHVIDAIYNYRAALQKIVRNIGNYDFSDISKTVERFKKIAETEKKKNPKKSEKYMSMMKVWNAEKNKSYIQEIYNESLKLLDRYVFAYDDLYQRQHCRVADKVQPVSRATPFFKKLPEIVSMNLNIEMAYQTRLKSWYSFIQKLITIAESMDIEGLKTFHDIYGCKFIIASEAVDFNSSEDTGKEICYRVLNAIFDASEELKAIPLPCKNVGKVSEEVYEEYRSVVKDYIANPKPNGYAALHVAFKIMLTGCNEEIVTEVQVCTSKNYIIQQTCASHAIHKRNTKKQIDFDPCLVRLSDFIGYSIDPDHEVYYDKGGLMIPKELAKEKMYYPS